MSDSQVKNHKYSNISAKKIKIMSAFRWLRILITIITVIVLTIGPFLPAFMKWFNLSESFFELSYEEYLAEMKGDGLLVIGFIIGGITGGFMFYAASNLSILGLLSSVASIIVTHNMYGYWPFTLILLGMFVLGFVLTFGGRMINSSDSLKSFIFYKEVIQMVILFGLSALYFFIAVRMPQDLAAQSSLHVPASLVSLLIAGGILFAYLFISALITAQIDDDRLMFLEAREAVHTLVRIEYDKVTDYGRYPQNW